jgi:NAD(P)H-flavin reductase
VAQRAVGTKTRMRNEIVEDRDLSPEIRLFKLHCPEIARAVKPGQFVVLRVDDYAERIPLTVADYDVDRGLITVIFQTVGASTKKMASLKARDIVMDVVGPLGQ